MKTTSIILSLGLSGLAAAQGAAWAQCGGNGFSGSTSCVSGNCCVRSNEWYSQCIPGDCGSSNSDSGNNNDDDGDDGDDGNTDSGISTPTDVVTKLPSSKGSQSSSKAISVSGTYDGGMKRFERSPAVCQEQKETGEKDAMFILQPGATLKNVIMGGSQAEGVHCKGTCTLINVWWADVCEDAATFKHTSGTSYVIGGGAFKAEDKIFQFNGKGTLDIKNFYAEDYGKVSRSCGTCSNSGPRHIKIDNVVGVDGGPLCGINTNFGDSCTITNSCQNQGKGCDRYTGTTGGGEPSKTGSGNDGTYCKISGLSKNC